MASNIRYVSKRQAALKQIEARLTGNMNRAGAVLESKVKQKLSQPGSGRVYRRGNVTHRASSPGQPPAPDTGALRASVTHRTDKVGGNIIGVVGTNKEYAPPLEFGTSRMAARPFLRNTAFESRGDILRALTG